MMPRSALVFISAVITAAIAGLATVEWEALLRMNSSAAWGLVGVVLMSVLSEVYSLRISLGRAAGSSSITFLPLIAAELLFGQAGAVVCALVVAALPAAVTLRKAPLKSAFNLSQVPLAAVAAGAVFGLAGGTPLGLEGPSPGISVSPNLLPFFACGVTFLLVNQIVVSVVISLVQGEPVRLTLVRVLGRSSSNLLYDVLILPVSLVVAIAYLTYGVAGFFACLLPLLFIRHAYWTNQRLAAANRDLLAALVKAIETRDPYTSGHSLRVSMLAKRAARHIGLPERRVQEIETAALLHDIGKIDPDCAMVLSKEGSLTHAERRAMESHVEKGVDLLTSLSSLPKEVIDAVRHHHERVDGKGYPDGLLGDEIPLGSRIIKVCDAVDAMLSDRPYRKALPLETVQEELIENSGTQFDRDVTDIFLNTKLLEEHVMEVNEAAVPGEKSVALGVGTGGEDRIPSSTDGSDDLNESLQATAPGLEP